MMHDDNMHGTSQKCIFAGRLAASVNVTGGELRGSSCGLQPVMRFSFAIGHTCRQSEETCCAACGGSGMSRGRDI